jgi:hypothetical protein
MMPYPIVGTPAASGINACCAGVSAVLSAP